MRLEYHPTVKRFRERQPLPVAGPGTLDHAWLRRLCLDCGADDAGLVDLVEIDPAMQREFGDAGVSHPLIVTALPRPPVAPVTTATPAPPDRRPRD